MKTILLTLALLIAATRASGEANVFDMPSKYASHLHLLSLMNASHQRQDYTSMEVFCRNGIELGSSDALWFYNLTCALALQGQTQAALTALDQAIAHGFADASFLEQDPDLKSLAGLSAFKQRLAQLKFPQANIRATDRPLIAITPDAKQTVMQTSSNTLWNFQLSLFHALFRPGAAVTNATYQGPEKPAIDSWLHAGTASGCQGVLYANRDNDTKALDITRFPGLLRLGYSRDMLDRKLNIGLPNTLFAFEGCDALLPVIGHSSMGYMNSPYWRSQPRAVCGDPRQTALQSLLLFGNQLFFYPAYGDYDRITGDLFPANTPYCFAVAGANSAEQPFVEAALAALAAFRPETRAELVRAGLLMPTLQMLFRASQRTVKKRQDYLSGVAHPPVFQSDNLDAAKLVQMAHAVMTNDLPTIVLLNVLSETQAVPDRDYFDILRSEQLFDSPLAVARVFRGVAQTRTLTVRAQCKRPDAKLHWVVLQGDPSKVSFAPCATNGSLMTITVAHHEPFLTPVGNGTNILTARVDIGVIAETAAGFSAPSFITFHFLGNERRTYAKDGRVLCIDYTRRSAGYVDPLMSYTRNWKDSYRYDGQGNLVGWTRRRGLEEERFTAYGHRVVSADATGRPIHAHVVRYMPRFVQSPDGSDGLPDLAQMDDNLEVTYRYASDADQVGAPDRSSIRQEQQPPASEL